MTNKPKRAYFQEGEQVIVTTSKQGLSGIVEDVKYDKPNSEGANVKYIVRMLEGPKEGKSRTLTASQLTGLSGSRSTRLRSPEHLAVAAKRRRQAIARAEKRWELVSRAKEEQPATFAHNLEIVEREGFKYGNEYVEAARRTLGTK